MNYQKQYNLLIEKAQNRSVLEGYKEKHHILPKCMGGTNDKVNIVSLTAREHYIAHWLLNKIYPDNDKLIYALNMMIMGRKIKLILSSKEYEEIKKKFSNNQKGEKNHRYGKGYLITGKNNPRYGMKNSKEHREKISKANKGHIVSEEQRIKISKSNSGRGNGMYGMKGELAPFYNKKHSKTSKNMISLANSKPFVIDGKKYKNLKDAELKLNIIFHTIRYRLISKSKKFKNYKYI